MPSRKIGFYRISHCSAIHPQGLHTPANSYAWANPSRECRGKTGSIKPSVSEPSTMWRRPNLGFYGMHTFPSPPRLWSPGPVPVSGSGPGSLESGYSTCCPLTELHFSGRGPEPGFTAFFRHLQRHFQDGTMVVFNEWQTLSHKQRKKKTLHKSPNLLAGKYSKINTF